MTTVGKILNLTLALTCVSAMATERSPERAATASAPDVQTSPRADNTDINERDKSGASKTPQDQSNQAQDRKLLAAVRRAIVGDKSLSTMAQNVKVMVEGGTVTLRGPVKSIEEKTKIASLAKQVKGITTTDNQLDVTTNLSTK